MHILEDVFQLDIKLAYYFKNFLDFEGCIYLIFYVWKTVLKDKL